MPPIDDAAPAADNAVVTNPTRAPAAPIPASPVPASSGPATRPAGVYILTADVLGGRAGHIYQLTAAQAAAAGDAAREPTEFERGVFGRPPLALD